MKTLIVAATRFEIQPFLDRIAAYPNTDYLITEVGMVQTAYRLGKHLANNQYDLIINIGIGGCFNRSLPIGAVVSIDREIFSELGAEDDERFIPIDELGFGNAHYVATQNKTTKELVHALPTGLGVTVNKVHGNELEISKLLIQIPNALIESMEGGSVFLVASEAKIQTIQIRGISNYVEKRNRATWNVPLAIHNSNAVLFEILCKIDKV
ncbi:MULTISPECIES: futalosine hydrolase [Sphingobacterium]|jgi:futalosine hydrolase|uniref:futalosine hydrolase n=1 Tax=Sphingobacterium TaxID=28453 RepID=UPI00105112BF|nr:MULTISPECIES: futalosine hydrolase [Sphingobacterium]MCW2261836.1 futalosine hydrolase [Sphingobacterium kitahiroshimense]NJI75563.1 futalosine hydrolase [Sphingobacterium sp. B16(2022)]TCR10146.1 futalosine hydrolase [Sphingobacterium sp. JUb78]